MTQVPVSGVGAAVLGTISVPIAIVSDPATLPVDGSVVLAVLRPETPIAWYYYGDTNLEYAEQVLLFFMGPFGSPVTLGRIDPNSDEHATPLTMTLPAGWAVVPLFTNSGAGAISSDYPPTISPVPYLVSPGS